MIGENDIMHLMQLQFSTLKQTDANKHTLTHTHTLERARKREMRSESRSERK